MTSTSATPKYKIVILNDAKLNNVLNDPKAEFKIIRVKHPKLGEPTPFILVKNGQETINLYELIGYNQDMGSLFVNQYVQSECKMYFSSQFNVNYFLIDFTHGLAQTEFASLKDFREKFIKYLLGDKLGPKENGLLTKLLELIDMSSLTTFCDVEDSKKLFRVKFNADKSLAWLKQKIEPIAVYLKEHSSCLDLLKPQKEKTKEDVDRDEAKIKLESFELLAQYLNKNLADTLRKELQLSDSKIVENSNGVKRQCIAQN